MADKTPNQNLFNRLPGQVDSKASQQGQNHPQQAISWTQQPLNASIHYCDEDIFIDTVYLPQRPLTRVEAPVNNTLLQVRTETRKRGVNQEKRRPEDGVDPKLKTTFTMISASKCFSSQNKKLENYAEAIISAIKSAEPNFKFTAVHVTNYMHLHEVERCFQALRSALRMLQDEDGFLYQVSLIIDHNNSQLIELVRGKTQKDPAEIEFLDMLDYEFDQRIIFQAKAELQIALYSVLQTSWIRDFVQGKDFTKKMGLEPTISRAKVVNVLVQFRNLILKPNGTGRTLKRRVVHRQFLE